MIRQPVEKSVNPTNNEDVDPYEQSAVDLKEANWTLLRQVANARADKHGGRRSVSAVIASIIEENRKQLRRRFMSPENVEVKERPEIERLIEAENNNFEISRRALGKTYELIENFQDVYDSLGRSVKMPDGGAVTEQSMVTGAIVLQMGISRRQFTLGILTLMRAHRGDGVLHLRRAIESCAFAARISRHPHFAKVWLDAGRRGCV